MARDRKRAKQRQQRRPTRGRETAAPGELHRAEKMGSPPPALEHASGEADEFDAALVRGAGGAPVPGGVAEAAERELEREDEGAGVLTGVDAGGRPPGGNGAAAVAEQLEEPEEERHAERREPRAGGLSLPARAVAFLRASWAELQRVQWPDRPQVSQATAVVLGFVAVAGVYLGVADWVAQKIINFVL